MHLTAIADALELKNTVEVLAATDREFVEHCFYLTNRLRDCLLPAVANWEGDTGGAAKMRAASLLPAAVRAAEGKAAGWIPSLNSKGWVAFAAHLIALGALLRHGDPLCASRRLAEKAAEANDAFHHGAWQRAKRAAESEGEGQGEGEGEGEGQGQARDLPKLADVPRKDLHNEARLRQYLAYWETHLEAARETVEEMLDVLGGCVDSLEKPRKLREHKDRLFFQPGYLTEAARRDMERDLRAADAEDDWLADDA
tara:strand:+ start:59 stop:823 length:765 start_codon:yes stop_codon:yes gene_type:complete